jgi:hypothetical protein
MLCLALPGAAEPVQEAILLELLEKKTENL